MCGRCVELPGIFGCAGQTQGAGSVEVHCGSVEGRKIGLETVKRGRRAYDSYTYTIGKKR